MNELSCDQKEYERKQWSPLYRGINSGYYFYFYIFIGIAKILYGIKIAKVNTVTKKNIMKINEV